MPQQDTKRCPMCEEVLSVDDFHRLCNDKLKGYCIKCERKYMREYGRKKAKQRLDDYLATGRKIMYKM